MVMVISSPAGSSAKCVPALKEGLIAQQKFSVVVRENRLTWRDTYRDRQGVVNGDLRKEAGLS
jgi:hypothetical protein